MQKEIEKTNAEIFHEIKSLWAVSRNPARSEDFFFFFLRDPIGFSPFENHRQNIQNTRKELYGLFRLG